MIRGKRPRGRPRKRWKDSVKEVLEKLEETRNKHTIENNGRN